MEIGDFSPVPAPCPDCAAGGCTPGECDCHDFRPLTAVERAARAERAAARALRVARAAARGERSARPGEACSCGRPAVVVYATERFGEVPYCGVPDGGRPPRPDAVAAELHRADAWMRRRIAAACRRAGEAAAKAGRP